MEKELRRCRSTLRILGTGVLAFVLWALIKPFLAALMILPEETETEAAEQFLEPGSGKLVLLIVILLLLILLSLGIRIYLGLSARAEGMGKPRGRVYVWAAFVFFFVQVFMFAVFLYQLLVLKGSESSIPETAASVLMEFSSAATMGGLAFTAARVKKLESMLQGQGE